MLRRAKRYSLCFALHLTIIKRHCGTFDVVARAQKHPRPPCKPRRVDWRLSRRKLTNGNICAALSR